MKAIGETARVGGATRWLTSVLLAVGTLGVLAAPSAAAGTLDQEVTPDSLGYYTSIEVASNQAVYQTFTAGRSGDLDSVDVFVINRSFTTGYSVDVGIHELDDDGRPNEPPIGTGSSESTLEAWEFGWVSVQLSSPAPVTSGEAYALTASVDTAEGSGDAYGWGMRCYHPCFGGGQSDYTGGQGMVRNQYGTWGDEAYIDYAFRTYVSEPAPSDDLPGGRLAFVQGSNIHVADLDGSDMALVTSGSSYTKNGPDWSPDGSSILYNSAEGGSFNIWVAEPDTGSDRRITTDAGSNSAAWSPDGEKVVFAGYRDGQGGLFVADADGNNEHRLTTGADFWPDWSPDGGTIAFTRSVFPHELLYTIEVDADGNAAGAPTLLSDTSLLPFGGADQSPVWSPDGSEIAFQSNRVGRYDVYVLDVATGDQRATTSSDDTELEPAWSPDGSMIVYSNLSDGHLHVVAPDGSGDVDLEITGEDASWGPLPTGPPPDTTPPTIMASRSPDPNSDGWNNSDVTVSFTCEDPESGITECSDPVTLSSGGAGLVAQGTATNGEGLTAEVTVGDINIDLTPPEVTYGGSAGTYTVDEQVGITCSATDAMSGVASDSCAPVSGSAYDFGVGEHAFSATATDLAGNEGLGSVVFTVEVTEESLGTVVEEFVDEPGIGDSITAKLDQAAAASNPAAEAGALNAFRRQVEAQRGKTLTDAEADLLIELSMEL